MNVLLSTLLCVAGLNQPASVSAVPTSPISIDLSWQDTSSGEGGFDIRRSSTGANGTFALLATTAANATRYSDTALNASTQ